MSDLVLLPRAQMRRIEPFFPRSRGLVRLKAHRTAASLAQKGVLLVALDARKAV